MTWRDWCGNGLADRWAKVGCVAVVKDSPVSTYHAQWARAIAWYRWVTRFATEWGAGDVEPNTREQARPPEINAPTPRQLACHQSHDVWRRND